MYISRMNRIQCIRWILTFFPNEYESDGDDRQSAAKSRSSYS